MGQNARDHLRHHVASVAAAGRDVDVHAVAGLAGQRLWREVGREAALHRDRVDHRAECQRVVRGGHRVGIAEVDLILPRTLFVVRTFRANPHLAERQADLPPDVLALVLRRNVHITCAVVGDAGRFAVLVPLEQIKFHLRAERKRNAALRRRIHCVLQDAPRVGCKRRPIRMQDVAEHPHHAPMIGPPWQHAERARVRLQKQIGVDLAAEARNS